MAGARIRFKGVVLDSEIPTPASGKASLFYNDTDKVMKAKLDNGTVLVLSVTQELVEDIVGNLFQDSTTIDVDYDDVGNVITLNVIQTALDISIIPNIPSGNLAATNVQAALNELQTDIDNINTNAVEVAQDAVGNILVDSSNIDFTYNDGTPSITADLTDTTVTAGAYGSATQVPSYTVDAQGRLTAATNVAIAVPSTSITDFVEAVQDAMGGALVDSSSIDFQYNDVANTQTAVVLPGGVNHDALLNWAANKHIDHSTVSLIAGTGISATGLGDLTASRTVNLANTTVTASSYGSATQVPSYTVNAQGQLTAAANVAIAIPSTSVTDFNEAAQDAIGSAIAAGTQDGVTATYSDAGNSLSFANTDKGSTAVATHVAAVDPHPQYLTLAEGDAAYTPLTHVGSGGTQHANATTSVAGFMSSADKTKLDGIGGSRIIKSGVVAGAAFLGAPRIATVTFTTAFPNTNYSIAITGANARTWSFQTKAVGSFVINSNANGAIAGDVTWTCISYGETVE